MVKNKEYSSDIIGQIVSLREGSHLVREITKQLGVSGQHSLKRWLRRFKKEGRQKTPKPKNGCGRPRKTSNRGVTVLERVVEFDVKTTARKIKQENSAAFQ